KEVKEKVTSEDSASTCTDPPEVVDKYSRYSQKEVKDKVTSEDSTSTDPCTDPPEVVDKHSRFSQLVIVPNDGEMNIDANILTVCFETMNLLERAAGIDNQALSISSHYLNQAET
ncbi:hypothetical protein J437_LFUL019046, partial [Ladona fulva]